MKGGFHHPWWVRAQSGSFPASRVTCVSVCGRGFVLRLRRRSQHLPKRGYYGSCWCNHHYIKSTHTSLSHSHTPTPSCCSAYRLENNLPLVTIIQIGLLKPKHKYREFLQVFVLHISHSKAFSMALTNTTPACFQGFLLQGAHKPFFRRTSYSATWISVCVNTELIFSNLIFCLFVQLDF